MSRDTFLAYFCMFALCALNIFVDKETQKLTIVHLITFLKKEETQELVIVFIKQMR
jgi:hypothetical protein